MTASTLPVLVLIAFLWWKTEGELLPILLFTSIFDAASVLNLGGSPVSPWLLALVLCLPVKVLSRRLHWKPIPGVNRAAYAAMLMFVLYAVCSSFLFPFLFHGIPVNNSRTGSGAHLEWSISNFAQTGYLLAAFTIFMVTIHSTREQLRLAVTWYIRACICIALFSMYQLANATLHVPYPSAILYTNTAHVIYDAYKIGGVWRLNSTFSEASAAAFYLGTGLALLGWQLATHRLRFKPVASFLLILLALVLTVSTLGYACLATVLCGSLLLYIRHTFSKQGVAPVKLLMILLVIAIAVPIFLLTGAGDVVSKVVMNVFVDKVGSDSYKERAMWNEMALQTFHDTYYLGAGWGSARASSFACSLLANVGIPGGGLFVFFLLQMIRPAFSPKRFVRFELFERALFGSAVMLVGLVVAGSDPVMPIIWVLFGIATAAKPRTRAARPVMLVSEPALGPPTLVAP